MGRIVFDLDGTLVDSLPTLAATGNRLLAELGRPAVPSEVVAGYVGNGVGKLVERLLRHDGDMPAGGPGPHVERFRALYSADSVTGTTLYPGVAEALAALASAGHGLAVCTQKFDAHALAILKALGLMPPITGFAGGESLGVLKPDPRMFAHAVAGLPPGPAVMVGDSPTDAETARRAGVPFLLHLHGYRTEPVSAIPHAAAFGAFADLPRLVDEVLGAQAPA